MSRFDYLWKFSNAQALASVSSGASVVSTNVTDTRQNKYTDAWGAALSNSDIGGLFLEVNVDTALVGASAAVDVSIVTKADVSISSGATVIGTVSFPALSAVGTKRKIQLPSGQNALRYVGVLYTANGAALTSAKFDAALVLGQEHYKD